MNANVHDVAEALGKTVPFGSLDELAALSRLVDIARAHGGDAGLACLAGLWLGQGMPEHEIVARLWPKHPRLTVVQ